MSEIKEITGKSILGLPVYSIREGTNLGQVKSTLIDAKNKCILALFVERRRFNREEMLLPFSSISGIGEDAITIDKASLMERKGANTTYIHAIRHRVQLPGAKAFTVGGKTLGKIEEYRFNSTDGQITSLEIIGGGLIKDNMLVQNQDIVTIAPHTVMLRDSALINATIIANPLISGMENAAEAMRDTASIIKNNTVEATKKLSANIGDKVSKIKSTNKEIFFNDTDYSNQQFEEQDLDNGLTDDTNAEATEDIPDNEDNNDDQPNEDQPNSSDSEEI